MGRVANGKNMSPTPRELTIAIRFRSLRRTIRRVLYMSVIVILMNYRDRVRRIHDGDAKLARAVNQPVVPSRSSYRKCGKLPRDPFGKNEIVDASRRMKDAVLRNVFLNVGSPRVSGKVDGVGYVDVPTTTHHEKLQRGKRLNGSCKTINKNNIRVDITE